MKINKQRQKKILLWDATLKAVFKQGFSNVTLQSIALEAGISKGGLTHYYSSKQELFRDAFIFLFEQIFSQVEETASQLHAPIDKLYSLSSIYTLHAPSNDLGYPVLHDFMALAAHDQVYRDIYNQWVERWVNFIEGVLREAAEQGSVDPTGLNDKARFLATFAQGVATRAFLAPEQHSNEWAVNTYHSFARQFFYNA